ncbi:MAG: DNA sulfur modification protein DndB [Pseudomonadota bacterium]
MSTVILSKPSALNVDMPGTSGSFSVAKKGEESKAIEVKYLLTHVALGGGGHQQQLLDMLAPVREVFDLEQLGFDEIMQRDIDDSRVSLDLIPYLLDHSNSGLVKLFPPIVVVVLPLQPVSRKPASHYAKITTTTEPLVGYDGHEFRITTAGTVGREQFQLREMLRPDKTVDPAHSVLRLAQGNCALAIVDGQHRAMALLALYRNLTGGWSDAKRAVYQQYYRVWPEEKIRGFDLNELQMPMIVCTFPQLDEDYAGSMDVIRAARRVFLDLNKNAKKVSDSRNKLLDDQDMVSQCLRAVLANVKAYDAHSKTPLRIWNVELDQAKDRSVISSPVALTGVSHLYYIGEHLLFYTEQTKDVVARKTFLARSRRLTDAYSRLGLTDALTSKEQTDNNRTNYTDKVADAIEEKWMLHYGQQLEWIFAKFHPFSVHCVASLDTVARLNSDNRTKLRALMFDGQSSARTFDEFEERLDLKIAEDSEWSAPELKSILQEVQANIREYQEEVQAFKAVRAKRFLELVKGPHSKLLRPSSDEISPIALEIINHLYSQIFTTIAFQTAVVLTLVEAYEAVHDSSAGSPYVLTEADVDQYVADLESLFKPTSFSQFASLSASFNDELREQQGALERIPSRAKFSDVVVSGEMKPDEWPKYRYLLLELWRPTADAIKKVVEEDLKVCRASVMKAAFRRELHRHCEENQVQEQDVDAAQRLGILDAVVKNYEQLLGNIRQKTTSLTTVRDGLKAQLGAISADDAEQHSQPEKPEAV